MTTITQRDLGRVRQLAPPARGDFGPHHQVVRVISPQEWRDADPFILLMDDRVDGRLFAGPHPHAGFETVSFLVDGSIPAENQHESRLAAGDVEWTTTGSGIVHGPDEPIDGQFRLLQLWMTLPTSARWTTPDHQMIRRSDAPVRREPGVEVRLYSGTTGSLTVPTRNRVPTTIVDVHLAPGAEVTQIIPASYNGFFYVLEGEASIGASAQRVVPGQVGWLDRATGEGDTAVRIRNGGAGAARTLFYAGERQNTPIAWYGPFIGDTSADIERSIERYKAGTFVRV